MEFTLEFQITDTGLQGIGKVVAYKIYPPYNLNIKNTQFSREVEIDTKSDVVIRLTGRGNYTPHSKEDFLLSVCHKIDVSNLHDEEKTLEYKNKQDSTSRKWYPPRAHIHEEVIGDWRLQNTNGAITFLNNKFDKHHYGLFLPYEDLAKSRTSFTDDLYLDDNDILIKHHNEVLIASNKRVVPKITEDLDAKQFILFRRRDIGIFLYSDDVRTYTMRPLMRTLPRFLFHDFPAAQDNIVFLMKYFKHLHVGSSYLKVYINLKWKDN